MKWNRRNEKPQDDVVENPLRQRKVITGLIVWAVAILLMIVVGTVALFHDPKEDAAPAPRYTTSEVCESGESDAMAINGRITHGWALVGAGEASIAVPHSKTHGPHVNDEGIRSCYNQSPEGAVLAATNILAMDNTGNTRPLIDHFVADGPAKDKLADTTGGGDPLLGARVEGFKLVHYSKDTAKVEVVLRYRDASVGVLLDLVWDGDWKWDVPTSLEVPMTRLDDLDGYTTFIQSSDRKAEQ